MFNRITYIFFFVIIIAVLSCAETGSGYELSAELSGKGFYYNPEKILKEFEKNSRNCQNNFILAKAYMEKKELKNALMYYANSCFDKKYNFNLRLFPQPVYSFVDSSRGRSLFYNDSLYEIASIFYEYGEHEYVIKFTSLVENDGSALYRESVILRSKSLQKLSRLNDAIDSLKDISSSYRDGDSLSMIRLRLGAVYESAGDFSKAADSYIDVVASGGGVWQNSVAAKRLIYLTEDKKIKLDSNEKKTLFASALYDAGDLTRAMAVADEVLRTEKSSSVEKIMIRILTLKNYSKATAFLKGKEGRPEYDGLLLEQANTLWDNGKKYDAVKIYDRLSSSEEKEISERVLTRLSFFYEERSRPELVKYMELYVKKFPESEQSGRFIWLMGRYYMKTGNNSKAAEYYSRGIKNYPDNSYASYCRFWLQKIKPSDNKEDAQEEFLAGLVYYNPDTYHALTLLKNMADRSNAETLQKKFSEAVKAKNRYRLLLYHTLLFMKNGYDSSWSERVKLVDSSGAEKFRDLAELIKNPSFSGRYRNLLKKIEVYFYAGDIDSINREIKIIDESDSDSAADLYLALTAYSVKHRYYNYTTFYAFKLLNMNKLKENLALMPEELASALYPYAFSECVDRESRAFNVKNSLLLSMMKVESNFNFKAVSPAGAAGLMQLMPPTAKGIAKELGISKYELFDPCISVKFGASYIAWLDRYYKGQIEYMVAGYNAGAGNVDKWKAGASSKELDYFSEFTPFDETRDYIFRTKKYMVQYESIYR